MGFRDYRQIGSCAYCKNKATQVFIRKVFLTINFRFLCDDCAEYHSRISDDIRANH